MWVLSIYKALKACKRTVSMQNILALYEYTDYMSFLNEMVQNGRCTKEKRDELTTKKIKLYAETAKNDAANIQLICEACESVFKRTPNRKQTTITDAFRNGAIIYFDLNGNSAEAATKLLGNCILAEIQHCIGEFSDGSIRKTVIADEASFYMSSLFKSCFNESRSAGFQFIVATQGPSDLADTQKNTGRELINQLSNNCGQFGILRMNSKDDAQMAADLIGTTKIAETTHRADSIDYNPAGSIKPIDSYIANPNTIKNLNKLEMIYYEKKDDGEHYPKPVIVKWRVDDLFFDKSDDAEITDNKRKL